LNQLDEHIRDNYFEYVREWLVHRMYLDDLRIRFEDLNRYLYE